MSDKMRITYDELNDPRVNEVLARQEEESAWRAGAPAEKAGEAKTAFIHRSWFYLLLAGLVGALIAWALVEPYFDDSMVMRDEGTAAALIMLLGVGGLTGLMIGAVEGLLARNYARAARCGLIGLGIGIGGGFVALIAAGLAGMLIGLVGVAIVGEEAASDPQHHFAGFL
ncbi:MAG: hypothetical protein FJY83_03800, partial [Candidatus Aminicenantes bacterium]|nr:hypothetical protein [Candidatus Aminicenantes bacterium]